LSVDVLQNGRRLSLSGLFVVAHGKRPWQFEKGEPALTVTSRLSALGAVEVLIPANVGYSIYNHQKLYSVTLAMAPSIGWTSASRSIIHLKGCKYNEITTLATGHIIILAIPVLVICLGIWSEGIDQIVTAANYLRKVDLHNKKPTAKAFVKKGSVENASVEKTSASQRAKLD